MTHPCTNPNIVDLSRRAFLWRSEMPLSVISLTKACLAVNGIYCEACRDSCEPGALGFVPQWGTVPRPVFDPDLCTQCGVCVRVCPGSAIRLRPSEIKHG